MDPLDWQRWYVPYMATMFVVMGLLELRYPVANLTQPYARRWTLNLALWSITVFLVYAVFRTSAVLLAASRPAHLSFVPFLLISDATLWLSHYAMHHIRPLWIWHSIHHSDPDMDASTGLRFHPVEGFWDQGLHLGLVYLLRPTPEAVLGLQFFTIASNFFIHSNIALPARLDQALGWVLMTPGLHRSHHSTEMHVQNSNYGVSLTLWDQLFQTLHRRPAPSTLGIEEVRPAASLQPTFLLFRLPAKLWKRL